MLEAIAQKIAEKTHSSTKEIVKSTMPYIPVMFRKNGKNLIDEFDLNYDEVEWLKKQVKLTNV